MASLSRTIKKAASSVISATNRTPRRNYTSAILITPLKTSAINTSTNVFRQIFQTTPIPTNIRSISDWSLLRGIDYINDDADKEFDDLEVAEIPSDFPFKIEDNPEEKFVTLTREYEDEEIKLTIQTPDVSHEYYSDKEEMKLKKKFKNGQQVYLDVLVRITKKCSATMLFHINANEDSVIFYHLALEDPNAPNEDIAYQKHSYLDMNLYKCLNSYLEVRGINHSISKFLYNYMFIKEHKMYIAWIKKLKNVIAN